MLRDDEWAAVPEPGPPPIRDIVICVAVLGLGLAALVGAGIIVAGGVGVLSGALS